MPRGAQSRRRTVYQDCAIFGLTLRSPAEVGLTLTLVPRLSRLRFMNTDRTELPVRRRVRSRGVPNALQSHPVAYTTHADEAAQIASHLLGRSVVVPAPGSLDEFHCALNAISFLDVTMAHLDFGVATDLSVHSDPQCYTVHMTTSGEAVVHIDGVDHLLSAFFALVVSPGTDYRLHLAHDCPQMVVRIEKGAVERQLTRLLGRSLSEPVIFEPVGDLTTEAASRWTGALNILSAEVMAKGSLIQQGIGAGPLEELIVSTLLYIQRSNYTDRLTRMPGRSGRAAVRRSIEYIEAHLAEPISLADLSQHARMSTRSIQAGFREDLATTPVSFIRDRRLDQVRRTLMSAIPGDGVTVTAVAQQWGFSHLGSFSGLYRRRFGELPSETLRR